MSAGGKNPAPTKIQSGIGLCKTSTGQALNPLSNALARGAKNPHPSPPSYLALRSVAGRPQAMEGVNQYRMPFDRLLS